jgi:cell division protein FtsB
MSQQVNLYNPIFRKQEKKFSAATMLQAGALVLAGIALMYGYAAWRTVALRVQLKDVNAQHAAAAARLNEVSAKLPIRHADPRLEQEVRDLERRIQAVQLIRSAARGDLFKGAPGYSDYLIALARQSASGLWLTGLTITGAGESLVLAGRTHSPELVPGYLQRLSGERTLAGLQFEIFQMQRPVRTAADAEKGVAEVLEPYVEFEVRSKPLEKKK